MDETLRSYGTPVACALGSVRGDSQRYAFLKILDDSLGYASGKFSSRFKVMRSPIACVAAAPITGSICIPPVDWRFLLDISPAIPAGRFEELLAVGCEDGQLHFVDLSWSSQQPLFDEATKVVQCDMETHKGRWDITKDMVW